MQRAFRFRRTTLITLGLLAFLAGLGVARTEVKIAEIWLWLIIIPFAFVAIKRKKAVLIAVIVIGLLLGWWRGEVFLEKIEPYKSIDKQTVVLEVTADSDGVYGNNAQLEFDANSVHVLEPFDEKLPGKVKVSGFGEQAVYRGDILRVEGKFFPTRGSRQGTVSYAELKVLGRTNSPIENIRLRFVAGMETALPEPVASFGLGLLIGQKTTLPDQVSDSLAAVGLTHIIAVSGYNLTIIVRAIRRFGKKRSKYQIALLSVVLIAGFLLVTGFSASIVRAAIVSGLSLIAWYYGRAFRPLLLLSLAAAMTAGWNPIYIWSDIGWYLSFLAFYGVIVLVPLLIKRIYGPKREPHPLTVLVLETLSAQLMTAPLILYIFGTTSLVALVSNLLVVPLVPIAMLLALFAGLTGMIVPVVSGWIAWPANILLTYMLDIASLLARLPNALIQRTLSLNLMLFIYVSIGFASFVIWRKTPRTVKITDTELESEL